MHVLLLNLMLRVLVSYDSASSNTNDEFLFGAYFVPNFNWQLYVATCSPARDAGAGYVAWGHSTLVGPVITFVYLFLYAAVEFLDLL